MTTSADQAPSASPGGPADERAHPADWIFTQPWDVKIANAATGEVSGVQSGVHIGDVHIGSDIRPNVFSRKASERELTDVAESFVEPVGFARAAELLHSERVVILCGRGTGRTFSGLRLLRDREVTDVVHLNPRLSLENVRDKDLAVDHGYLWGGATGDGTYAFDEREFSHLAHLVRDARAALVLIVDRDAQVPPGLARWVVRLAPPNPVEIATARVRAATDWAEEAMQVLKSDFVEMLGLGCAPGRAELVAEFAIKVAAGTVELAAARAELDDDVAKSVAVWFGPRPRYRTTIEYAMLVAVSIFRDRPYELVVRAAVELETLIRTAELPPDKKPRPRKLFEMSREDLIAQVGASVQRRPHPEHVGLFEETVAFPDAARARAVVAYVWHQFAGLQDHLVSWLAGTWYSYDFFGDSAVAFSTVLGDVPSHEPLLWLSALAGRPKTACRELAARTVAQLLGDARMAPVVAPLVDRWVTGSSARAKATAATVFGTAYGDRHPELALANLEVMATDDSSMVRNAVVRSVFYLFGRRSNQRPVLEALCRWSRPTVTRNEAERERAANRRAVGLMAASWVLGLSGFPSLAAALWTPTEDESALAGRLLRALLQTNRYATGALGELLWFAERVDMPYCARHLRLLLDTVVPELPPTGQPPLFADLSQRFPVHAHRIANLVDVLRRLQRDEPAGDSALG